MHETVAGISICLFFYFFYFLQFKGNMNHFEYTLKHMLDLSEFT